MKTKKLSKIKVPSACRYCSCCTYFTPSDGKVNKDPGEGVCMIEHLQYREWPKIFTLFDSSCLGYKYSIHDYFDVKNISDVDEFGDAYCIRNRLKSDISRENLKNAYQRLVFTHPDNAKPSERNYLSYFDFLTDMLNKNNE